MSDEFVCLTCWEGDRRSGNGKNSTTRYSACQFQGPLEHIVLCCSYSDCPPRPNPKCRTISCRMSVSVHSVCWQFLPSRDPHLIPMPAAKGYKWVQCTHYISGCNHQQFAKYQTKTGSSTYYKRATPCRNHELPLVNSCGCKQLI